MVDVGEQTGALPRMLGKVADNYDDRVDRTVTGLTALIEPILIVFLAVIVGSIVIAKAWLGWRADGPGWGTGCHAGCRSVSGGCPAPDSASGS